MRPYFIPILLSLLSAFSGASGQDNGACSIKGPLFFRAEEGPHFNGSLQEYFGKELEGHFPAEDGTISLQLLVDTAGKVCCMKIENAIGVSAAFLVNSIANMPAWIPARQNHYLVNFAALVKLSFKDSKLLVTYINEKAVAPQPILNTNTSNNPKVLKQKDGAIWRSWDVGNSMLPANLSRNVAMDGNGIIWYCTDRGIVRIADDKWQIFSGMNVPALAGRNNTTWTVGLTVDRKDNVWVLSQNNVVRYDGRNWITYDTSNSPLKLVRKIYADRAGILWFCTFNGLVRYDGANWTTFSMANSPIASNDVRGVYLDNNGTVWIATSQGINKMTNGAWSTINKSNSDLPDSEFTCINGDRNGNIWAGMGERDKCYLVKIDTAGHPTVFTTANIWNITADDNTGKLWLATNGQGLVCFDGAQFSHFDQTNSPVPGKIVSDILIDRNGDKWMATFGGLVFTTKK
jgi:ligand-binding sensor domain-containing protein